MTCDHTLIGNHFHQCINVKPKHLENKNHRFGRHICECGMVWRTYEENQ